ncbi:DUF3892 domain-containing protein [Bacillus sp. RG28]|uniref:DUF3892 domain-containing protein n=1 Tax=Gottfriedia endophytica TaxID=2820819 RepID=A0A940NRR2_9BACI|nr:DUF3892 domain-containing protein [Gottfriedia endophytica]MBP0723688.1 DUF3892 domain-containing protein [Gottfriedia endophytica]
MTDRFEEAYEQYKKDSGQVSEYEKVRKELDRDHIVAVRKNDDGDLIAFKTSQNRELDYLQALEEIKQGKLSHVDIIHKYRREIIRNEPDGIPENNLSNLPEF